MITVGILYTQGLGQCPSSIPFLSQKEEQRILKIKNVKRRCASLFSRLLLKRLYEEKHKEKMPEIFYTVEGKPYFKENLNCPFSISHDEDIAVVAISDENSALGVDVQSFSENEKMRERIEKRFLLGLSFDNLTEIQDISFRFFTLKDEKELSLVENCDRFAFSEFSYSSEKMTFLKNWTRLEASLKLFGRGFKDLKNANECLQNSAINTAFLQHGGVCYALSVALEK